MYESVHVHQVKAVEEVKLMILRYLTNLMKIIETKTVPIIN